MPRHRHKEFLQFLRKINRETPAGLDLHLIVDNASTHKHANVKAWLSKHPRFHLHFTPTSSSWLNLIERWFGELTRKRIRRDSFYALSELIAAIEHYRCKAILETQHYRLSATMQVASGWKWNFAARLYTATSVFPPRCMSHC
jgi:transposase